MTDQSLQVLQEAMRLSAKELAEVAAELLASLDEQVDPDAEAAWGEELERRAKRQIAGESEFQDWTVVREELRRRLESAS